MRKNVVHVNLSNGFGNNLFQYIYARLIAESHGSDLSVSLNKKGSYAAQVFSSLGITLRKVKFSGRKKIKVNDDNASLKFLRPKYKDNDFDLKGNFENYKLYIEHIDKIKKWFPTTKLINKDDLVFHLRLGDRLLYKETYNPLFHIEPSQYVNAISQFKFKRLHIVTDMKKWDRLTSKSLSRMKFHTGKVKKIMASSVGIKDIELAVNYFNSIYDSLNEFEPIVRADKDIAGDFNYMRSFDNILFQHGTMSWWASMLSEASNVKVYKHWRPAKGKNNKNLSKVNLPNWTYWQ